MTALEPWNEIIALAASALLLAAYHLWLRLKVRRHPAFTVQAVNRLARTAWVESIMTEPGKEVLAVQTLRNSTMAATFAWPPPRCSSSSACSASPARPTRSPAPRANSA